MYILLPVTDSQCLTALTISLHMYILSTDCQCLTALINSRPRHGLHIDSSTRSFSLVFCMIVLYDTLNNIRYHNYSENKDKSIL
jgi:hypothetical protein